jgi:hypothetical protein
MEVVNLLGNPMSSQINTLVEFFPQARAARDSMSDVILYSQIWSIYTIFYFFVVLVGAVFFVRYLEKGRRILEIACWIGLINACSDSILSYIQWKYLHSAFTSAIKTMGGGLGNLFLLGMIPIILGFFLWIIPSIVMIVYFRSSKLKMLMQS